MFLFISSPLHFDHVLPLSDFVCFPSSIKCISHFRSSHVISQASVLSVSQLLFFSLTFPFHVRVRFHTFHFCVFNFAAFKYPLEQCHLSEHEQTMQFDMAVHHQHSFYCDAFYFNVHHFRHSLPSLSLPDNQNARKSYQFKRSIESYCKEN